MIQTSKEYKQIHAKMATCILSLIVVACKDEKKGEKIENFLTKDLDILNVSVYKKLFNFTKNANLEDYENFVKEITPLVIIDSFSLEKLTIKANSLFEFAKKQEV